MGRSFIPVSLKEANRFITMYHRHSDPVRRAKFSIGLVENGELIGVAVAGNPIARLLSARTTIEILRTCVKPGHENANSQLYARVRDICQRMGYLKVVTYTLKSEPGTSLIAVGATPIADCRPQSWDRPHRHRAKKRIYDSPKTRWELLNIEPRIVSPLKPEC